MKTVVPNSRAMGAIALAGAIAAADPAFAYVGPGAGLTLIGSLVAVAAAVVLVLAGLVLFPLRMALKKVRQARESSQGADAPNS